MTDGVAAAMAPLPAVALPPEAASPSGFGATAGFTATSEDVTVRSRGCGSGSIIGAADGAQAGALAGAATAAADAASPLLLLLLLAPDFGSSLVLTGADSPHEKQAPIGVAMLATEKCSGSVC